MVIILVRGTGQHKLTTLRFLSREYVSMLYPFPYVDYC